MGLAVDATGRASVLRRGPLGQVRLAVFLDGGKPTGEEYFLMGQCTSQETIARLIVWSIINQVGDLSDDTLGCVWGILGETDLKRLFNDNNEDEEIQCLALQTYLNASLCLTNEEAARADTAIGSDEIPIAGFRCLAGLVGEGQRR